jgi:hypothetical protein
VDTTVYWWTNIAVPDTGKTRVLASDTDIISFIAGSLHGERLPHINAMPGADISYPSQATRSFDFFIQPENDTKCTWEASAFENGLVFYERSTPPLSCKKMFCWGNHHAGRHWQEFLSDKGHGYYVELQAGIARSQLHDKKFPANSTYEWTQCFSGVKLSPEKLHAEDYHAACAYFGAALDERLSEDALHALDARLRAVADLPVREEQLVHTGSGFGALEILRMQQMKDGIVPGNLCFPRHTIGRAEYPWYHLLTEGVLPPEDEKEMLSSFMVSEKWLPLLEKSLARDGGSTWYSQLQYGIAVYEGSDFTDYAMARDNDAAENERRTLAAEAAWKQSLAEKPSFWAYRNLAVLEDQRGNKAAARDYYEQAIAQEGAFADYALAAEYMGFLKKLNIIARTAMYTIPPAIPLRYPFAVYEPDDFKPTRNAQIKNIILKIVGIYALSGIKVENIRALANIRIKNSIIPIITAFTIAPAPISFVFCSFKSTHLR